MDSEFNAHALKHDDKGQVEAIPGGVDMYEDESALPRGRSSAGGRSGSRGAAGGAMPAAGIAMLDAAEQLFAEHGIHHVSTREILRASGQSNQSALTYHFGDRLQLVAALLDRRNGIINDLRHQRLDELAVQQRDGDSYALIETLVTSVTDVIRRETWGRDFVLTSVQVLLDPQLPVIEALLDTSRRSAYARAVGLLRGAEPTLPERVFDARMRMIGLGLATNLSKWLRANGPATRSNARRYDEMVRNNIEFMSAGFSAPVRNGKSHGHLMKGRRR